MELEIYFSLYFFRLDVSASCYYRFCPSSPSQPETSVKSTRRRREYKNEQFQLDFYPSHFIIWLTSMHRFIDSKHPTSLRYWAYSQSHSKLYLCYKWNTEGRMYVVKRCLLGLITEQSNNYSANQPNLNPGISCQPVRTTSCPSPNNCRRLWPSHTEPLKTTGEGCRYYQLTE